MAKKIYDMSVDELKKKSKYYKIIFYFYFVAAIVVIGVNGFSSMVSVNNVMSNMDALGGTNFLLLLNVVLVSFLVLFVIFLWLVSESSYYKMLECFSDLMVYLKQKEK